MANREILVRHIDSIDNQNMGLPRFPERGIQEQYVGRSGRAALEEVWPFFEVLDEHVPISSATRVLDFGVGWGRIARLFHGLTEKMVLADISQQAIDLTRNCGVHGELVKIEHGDALPLESASIDLAYAYSVFSHISEESARHWLNDIARVLKTGGAFVFTTHSVRFLHLVRACRNKRDANEIEQRIGNYFADPDAALADFEGSRHVFSGTGGGPYLSAEHYGWAAIPQAWLSAEASGTFSIERYVDDPSVLEQAIFVLRRL